MRTFTLTVALWHDPYWRQNLRRSWKVRRYWLARPSYPHTSGRAVALQLGPWTLRITAVSGATHARGYTRKCASHLSGKELPHG